MFKLFLFGIIVVTNIQVCPAPCYDDCNVAENMDAGLYDDFCKEARLFKPYIKIYKHRSGSKVDSGGPKMYVIPENEKYEDIYVCVNGPAWFYHAKHTPLGLVFHKPEMKVFIHECQFFNGKKGPGSRGEENRLMAILLMGDPMDYRKPSMQLFTAPLYNNETNVYENVTSIMTFGKMACHLQRGPKEESVQITILPNPDDSDSYCQMPYQAINSIFTPSGGGLTPIDPKTVLEVLKNNVALKQIECEKPVIIPAHSAPSTILKILASKRMEINRTKLRLENEMASIVLNISSNIQISEAGSVSDNITAVNNTIITDYLIKLADDSSTAEVKLQAMKDKKAAENIIKINQFRLDAINACDLVISADSNTTYEEAWVEADGFFDTGKPEEELSILLNYLQVLNVSYLDWKLAEKNYTANKSNKTIRSWYNNKKRLYETQFVNVRNQLASAMQKIAIAETASRKRLDQFKTCQRAIARISNPSLPKPGPMSTIITIEQRYGPYDAETQSCVKMRTLKEVCEEAKPNKNRACHFLKAILKKPETCLQYENNTVVEVSPETTTEKSLGKQNNEILDLIQDIYGVACTLFHDITFAERITSLFKCYLMKPVEYEGAGMTQSTVSASNPYSGSKTDSQMVTQILEALKICKAEKRKLIFEKVSNSGPGKKQKRYKYLNKGDLLELHLHSEQADKEFAFNFAIDMHFKMFATVMGLCMSSQGYNNRNPLISAMFYATYTRIFYDPLKFAWTSPEDNIIFDLMLGNFKNHNGELFANYCLEASFVHGGDIDYRPPRKLFVNGNTEPNYFTSGNLTSKSHKYLSAFN